MKLANNKFIKYFFSLYCFASINTLAVNPDEIDAIFGCVTPIEPPTPPLPGTGCLSDIDILKIITPEPGQTCSPNSDTCPPASCIINVPAIVQENLYIKTSGPVTRRSLLDEPSLRDYILEDCALHFVIHPFYNYTPRVFFTKDSPFIRSYIDLTNQNIINEIDQALEITGCTNVDIPKILGLFKDLKLQQHRAGIMFGIGSKVSCVNLSFRIPLYYIAEHFFMNEEEIEAIGNSSFITEAAPISVDLTSKEKGEEFGKQHLVSDRIGLGDMRVNALFNIFDDCRDHFWFGPQLTIPTAVTIKAGLIGAKFNPCKPAPPFNIKEIFELLLCPETIPEQRGAQATVVQMATNFFVGAIDRLSTILFNAPLGNGGHFGIGPQLDFVHEFNEYWSLQTYAAFEGFSRHNEDRFFLVKKRPSDFNRDFRNEAQTAENLSFLNQQIINTFFPVRLRIPVRPGYLGKYATSLVCESINWHGFIGLDYWYQAPEKLFVNDQLLAEFDIEKGTRPAAHQGKFFFSFGYRNLYHCDRIFLDLEFTGDITFANRGIGKSYTLGFRVSLDV